MSRDEIRAVNDILGGMLTVIRNADPADRHEIFRALGIHLTYDDKTRKVLVDNRPAPNMFVQKVSEVGVEHYARTMSQPLQHLVVLS
ncbi:hypothetical protein OG216_35335 [Streptomycetaceae bacterium NBC_01309]